MTESYVPVPTPDESPSDPPVTTGPWAAVVRILSNPADVFALVRARSPWLPPFLLLGIAASALAVAQVLVTAPMMQDLMAVPELADELPAGFGEGLVIVSAVLGGAFALVTPAIVGLVFALALYVSGLIFNSKANFTQLFSLAGYAEIPALFGMLLSLALIVIAPEQALAGATSGQAGFDLSLAVLLPPEAALKPLGILASMISPFSVWTWVLVALGLRHVGDVSARTAWWQVLTVFAVSALLRLAMGSVAAAFANLGPSLSM